jgi:hypothetical protein
MVRELRQQARRGQRLVLAERIAIVENICIEELCAEFASDEQRG